MKQASGTPVQTAGAELSERAIRVLEVIRDFTRSKGFSPTLREIGDLSGIPSVSNVVYHLDLLQRRQLIQRHPYISRSTVLTERGRELIAGEPGIKE